MPIRTLTLVAVLAAAPAFAQDAAPDSSAADPTATTENKPALIAEIRSAEGESLGLATVTDTPAGMALVALELRGLPPGAHGAHIHETGSCTPPDFDSAGGHLAGDKDHGVMSENGPHPGDLPNIHVGASGELSVEYFVAGLTTGMMTDEDGAALVIHQQPDDYLSQPSGDAGSRLGCGSFAATQ